MTRQRAEVPGPEGSVGTRFPYTEICTVELDGRTIVRDCASNESGILIVRGPHVLKGYFDPDDNAQMWVEGDWFDTGDVAFIDPEGFINFTRRAKDLIIRGGHNIDPSRPGSCYRPTGPYAGELPIAYVQVQPEYKGAVSETELLAYCQQTICEGAAAPKRVDCR